MPPPERLERTRGCLAEALTATAINSASDLLGEYPAVQYVPPVGSFHLDLLTRLGEAFRFEDLKAARVPFGPLTVTVATPDTLYRMKRNTVRLKDRADAELLRQCFRLDEDL